jgi:hypothetical protein
MARTIEDTASFVLVQVEPLEQLTLPGQQVQQSALVLERALEFEPDVVQPLAPDLQLGLSRRVLLWNRRQQIDQRCNEGRAGLVRRRLIHARARQVQVGTSSPRVACTPSSKPPNRPTICSISRPPARSSSLVALMSRAGPRPPRQGLRSFGRPLPGRCPGASVARCAPRPRRTAQPCAAAPRSSSAADYLALVGIALVAPHREQRREPGHFRVHAGLFDDQRVARSQRLHFGIRQRRQLHVFQRADALVALHHLGDETRLGLQCLPHVAVETAFRDVAEDLHVLALIALAQDAPLALFDVAGTPGRIEVMQRAQAGLHVGADAHLGGRTEQHPDPSLAHRLE